MYHDNNNNACLLLFITLVCVLFIYFSSMLSFFSIHIRTHTENNISFIWMWHSIYWYYALYIYIWMRDCCVQTSNIHGNVQWVYRTSAHSFDMVPCQTPVRWLVFFLYHIVVLHMIQYRTNDVFCISSLKSKTATRKWQN